MQARRPILLTLAASLLILAGLMNWIGNFLPDNNDPDSLTLFVGYCILVLGVLGPIAAFGLFKRQHWGVLAGCCICILNGCLWIGGIPSDSPLIKGFSIGAVALNALIIALTALLLRNQAHAAKQVGELS